MKEARCKSVVVVGLMRRVWQCSMRMGWRSPDRVRGKSAAKLLLRCNAGETTSGVSQQHPSMMPQHDAGNADAPAATCFGGMRSPAQTSTAQPPDRPHGMLGERFALRVHPCSQGIMYAKV